LRKSGCAIECENCPYFKNPCFGCTIIKICLVARCLLGEHHEGLTYPRSFCKLRPYCPRGGESRPPPIPIHSVGKKPMTRINFSKFVPEIDTTDQRSWFWREGVPLPMIFVPLWQLLLNEDALSKASSMGLHDYLGFTGKILLSTVMPDELIDKLAMDDYSKLIKDLRPDATMVPDNYTYTDVPLHQSWSQTIRLASFANDFLELDIPAIGLVKGGNLRQMEWIIHREMEMGYVSFAMPARELYEESSLDEYLPYVLTILKRNAEAQKREFELLLYGIGKKLRRYKGISYSNLSWFIQAKHAGYYKNGLSYDMRDPVIRFEECFCETCKGLIPQELLDLWLDDEEACIRALAAHNLLDLKRSLKSEWALAQS